MRAMASKIETRFSIVLTNKLPIAKKRSVVHGAPIYCLRTSYASSGYRLCQTSSERSSKTLEFLSMESSKNAIAELSCRKFRENTQTMLGSEDPHFHAVRQSPDEPLPHR